MEPNRRCPASGRVNDAADSYYRALALRPDPAEGGFPSARVNLASLYHKHLQLDEALEHYAHVLRLPSTAVGVSLRLFLSRVRRGSG